MKGRVGVVVPTFMPRDINSQHRREPENRYQKASMLRLRKLCILSFVVAAATQPNPGKVTGDISVHDPTMCRDSAGTYFIFGTLYLRLLRSTCHQAPLNSYGYRYSHYYFYGSYRLESYRYGLARWRTNFNESIHRYHERVYLFPPIQRLHCSHKPFRALWAPDCTYLNDQFYVGTTLANQWTLHSEWIVILCGVDFWIYARRFLHASCGPIS